MVVLRVQGLILLHGAIHRAWAVRGSKSGISGRNQRSFFFVKIMEESRPDPRRCGLPPPSYAGGASGSGCRVYGSTLAAKGKARALPAVRLLPPTRLKMWIAGGAARGLLFVNSERPQQHSQWMVG